MKAYYYDIPNDKNVEFESLQPHCGSCIEDEYEGYRSWMDCGCCCRHQMEGEEKASARRGCTVLD